MLYWTGSCPSRLAPRLAHISASPHRIGLCPHTLFSTSATNSSQVEGLRLAEAAASSPTAQLSAGTQQLSLKSAPQALALLWRTHGWRCLYAGLSINYMKVSRGREWH